MIMFRKTSLCSDFPLQEIRPRILGEENTVSSDLIKEEWKQTEEFIRKTGRPEPLFKVDKLKTALVVIDMQNAFVAPGSTIEVPRGREIVRRSIPWHEPAARQVFP